MHDKSEYYRNQEDIVSREGIPVESGSLWEFKDNQLVLVDDDQYASVDMDDQKFKKE
ncbi:hypothetical protein J0871_17040 [Salegentibacter sp. BDJ18]|uniref:hypothetical protein n=1 Tax=Salegentibacter sp. BDJ18 TaxID=2816376 RepID=UPI001AAF44F3|nr:hypothetical protein [Salegentibacter sp. BDJ18]MBO2546125.1 hypothetical protein [Salegentibacter sp. BDJ18]